MFEIQSNSRKERMKGSMLYSLGKWPQTFERFPKHCDLLAFTCCNFDAKNLPRKSNGTHQNNIPQIGMGRIPSQLMKKYF
jgi:hypothetical protein